MPPLAITPTALYLLGIHAATSEGQRGRGFGRDPWLSRVLIEQLLHSLQAGSPSADAAARFVDPQRGVTTKAIARAAHELVENGFMRPAGVGRDAEWSIPTERAGDVATLWSNLRLDDQHAIHLAAQRAVAISVAWSKTSCA